jgi:hypothetical protein
MTMVLLVPLFVDNQNTTFKAILHSTDSTIVKDGLVDLKLVLVVLTNLTMLIQQGSGSGT